MVRTEPLTKSGGAKLTIAVGADRFSTDWKNAELTWKEFTERLTESKEKSFTLDEYYSWVDADGKDTLRMENAKDVGGFFGGELAGPNRTDENIVSKSVITLDADNADNAFLSVLEANDTLAPLTYIVHTTMRSAVEAPRYRVIIPLSHGVSEDEYRAISKSFVDSIGAQYFDAQSSTKPAQLMYWPTHTRGYEPTLIIKDGYPADVEQHLYLANPEKAAERKTPKTDEELRSPAINRNSTMMSEGGIWMRSSPDFDRKNPNLELLQGYCARLNAKFSDPLGDKEVSSCARKLFKYAQKDAAKIKTGELVLFMRAHKITDYGMAERFLDKYSKQLRYDPVQTAWLVYDGTRWEYVGKSIKTTPMGRVVDMLRDLPNEFEAGEIREAAEKYAHGAEKAGTLNGVYGLCAAVSALDNRDLDKGSNLLNMVNGTLDLAAGTLRAHSPDDLLTMRMPVAYDPAATCPRFDKFLEETFDSPSTRDYVRRLFGYTLSVDTREHIFVVHYGIGRNGKSVLINTLANIMGGYALAADIQSLSQAGRANNGSAPSPDIYTMKGHHFIYAEEGHVSSTLNDGLIKRMAAGGDISCRALFSGQETFPFIGKLHIVANHKPKVRDDSLGMWERVHLLPYNNVVPRERRDKFLEEQLIREAPGILNWMLRGYAECKATGLGTCVEVEIASEEYRKECDVLSDFLFDMVESGVPAAEGTMAVYKAYQAHSTDNGIMSPITQKEFARRMRDRGVQSGLAGPRRTQHYLGIKLVGSVDTVLIN